jgi:DNA-binding transcriptional LysR family regulator
MVEMSRIKRSGIGGGFMDELRLIRVFVQVVDSGSISAASRHLNTSVTSVARQIGYLETKFGVRLLNRTTRRQSLTEVGQFYYSKLLNVVREIDDIQREVSSYQETAKGRLRVHLRATVGNQVIVPALPRFFAEYPDITLDVTLTDEKADLVALGIDVAVWLGNLEDSSLIARRLSPSKRVLCASPGYLERNGNPAHPHELASHNCIVYRAKHYDNRWRFKKNGETIEVPVSGNLETENGAVLFTSALNGLGLIIVQESTVREALAKGDLVAVLADHEVSPTVDDTALYAVHPGSRHTSPKTRAFIDFLVGLFRQQS